MAFVTQNKQLAVGKRELDAKLYYRAKKIINPF